MFNFLNFPQLKSEGYTETSESTWDYNCVAWAVGRQDNWWWPFGRTVTGFEAFWPRGAPRKDSVHAFERMFSMMHYKRCKNENLETSYEKVAIFAIAGKVKHAARQLEDGSWTHKMGESIDLVTTLRAVEGPLYGNVILVMRRRRN